MSPQLLKLLEFLGRFGMHVDMQNINFDIGTFDSVDSCHGTDWHAFRHSQSLWQAWGPVPGSPWEPFHCVTLFAAVDELEKDSPKSFLGPVAVPNLPDSIMNATVAPPWAEPGILAMIDLPGPESVAFGYHLAATAGFQPVCTFDNWPHKLGVLRSERVLGALLYYAVAMNALRTGLTPASSPVWICDRERFTGSKPEPGRFDNRYIIEDRLLPGPHLLRAAGIHKIIYVGPGPVTYPAEDIRGYLEGLMPYGIVTYTASPADPATWVKPTAYIRKLGTPSGWSVLSMNMIRSSAGGFGGFVPEPSSGGG